MIDEELEDAFADIAVAAMAKLLSDRADELGELIASIGYDRLRREMTAIEVKYVQDVTIEVVKEAVAA